MVGLDPATLVAQTATSRVGTYGQYSLGVAGQVIDTGWVGFVRGDYRKGDSIEGWTANAGLRYNFVPERAPVHKMVVKGPPIPTVAPYIWSGIYVGGHFGVGQGEGHVGFPGTAVTVDPYIGGYLAGGQIGFNIQNGPWVFGLEAEYSKSNIKGTKACGTDPGFDLVDGQAFDDQHQVQPAVPDLREQARLAGHRGGQAGHHLLVVRPHPPLRQGGRRLDQRGRQRRLHLRTRQQQPVAAALSAATRPARSPAASAGRRTGSAG